MVNCAPTKEESYDVARESFVWYVKRSVELITSVASWLEEMKQGLGTYAYLEQAKEVVKSGVHQALSFDYLRDSKAVLVGDPDEVLETARAYRAAGVDLLLCLVNPYKIPHEKVCQTIELIGKHVIPELAE
jgi:alkanesulfonate monooxygenase SsuD/methylene tetrahydromethanopterin reductase-like flavin-dependent oxidoreductase (luciferase family)